MSGSSRNQQTHRPLTQYRALLVYSFIPKALAKVYINVVRRIKVKTHSCTCNVYWKNYLISNWNVIPIYWSRRVIFHFGRIKINNIFLPWIHRCNLRSLYFDYFLPVVKVHLAFLTKASTDANVSDMNCQICSLHKLPISRYKAKLHQIYLYLGTCDFQDKSASNISDLWFSTYLLILLW